MMNKKVLHIQFDQLTPKTQEAKSFKLFQKTSENFFSKKNSRNSYQPIHSTCKSRLYTTDSEFYRRKSASIHHSRLLSGVSQSKQGKSLFDKSMLTEQRPSETSISFFPKRSIKEKRKGVGQFLYKKIQELNKDLISSRFYLHSECSDMVKTQETQEKEQPSTTTCRIENKRKIKFKKQSRTQVHEKSKVKPWERKGFNHILSQTRKKMRYQKEFDPWQTFIENEDADY